MSIVTIKLCKAIIKFKHYSNFNVVLKWDRVKCLFKIEKKLVPLKLTMTRAGGEAKTMAKAA